MSPRRIVLIVDDEVFVRESLVDLLENEGYATVTAESASEALKVLGSADVHVIVTDLRMPSGDGLSLLEETRRQGMDVPVILLTGVGTVSDAVRAMKAGAYDFVQKPVEPQQFVHLVERAVQHRSLLSEVRYLRSAMEDLRGSAKMVGSSPPMDQLRSLIARVAATDATVLITGESGTGKELVAAEIHRLSTRAHANFVSVNCAAIPETLFESEFFGHRKGAFTSALADRMGRFAEAEGGTLALDEIGTLRQEMQAKLLRVLETGEYQVIGESRTRIADVRVIAITNEDLAARVRGGGFRPDLFYRLNVFPIEVPPLRDRKEDIAVLAEHFARRVRGAAKLPETETPRTTLSPEACEVLRAYDWPGNVRELRNVVERAAILAGGQEVDAALLRKILVDPRRLDLSWADPRNRPDPRRPSTSAHDEAPSAGAAGDDLHLRRRTEMLERRLIEEALKRVGGRKRDAAALLGIDPKNLAYYLKKHEVTESATGDGASQRPAEGGASGGGPSSGDEAKAGPREEAAP